MADIGVALIMLTAVAASALIVRVLPLAVPTPLLQIALGAGLAAVTDFQVRLEPEIFFLLFLPPLLFLDGWRIPKEGLLRDKGTILELALGLVVATVLGMGLFIHWLIPAIPLSRCPPRACAARSRWPACSRCPSRCPTAVRCPRESSRSFSPPASSSCRCSWRASSDPSWRDLVREVDLQEEHVR